MEKDVYELKIYENSNGNRPLEKYIATLLKEHKDDEVTKIKAYLDKLAEYGFLINDYFNPKAIKRIKENIYELRPDASRIFFFCYQNGVFIILHGYEKKQNKTDPKEIKKAIKERNDFLKGAKE